MTKVLIVEDEEALVTLLRYNLDKQGYETAAVMDGNDVLDSVKTIKPDLILLDWMLPNMSGVEICQALRQNVRFKHIPVIMLTARGEEADKVNAFAYGADDYMTKPFSLPELMARIRALLRRAPPKQTKEKKRYCDLSVDFDKKLVMRGKRCVKLGPTEFRLLETLLQEPEKVFSRDVLKKALWGQADRIELRTVDVHIKRLRQSLKAGGESDIIRTIRSTGYALSTAQDRD